MEYRTKAMDLWYRQLPGALIAEKERKLLDQLLPQIPGQFLVQIGGPSDLNLVESSPIQAKYYMSCECVPGGFDTRVQLNLQCLPLVPHSIDVIVIAHLLGFSQDPYCLLEEAFHSLKPGGSLFVLGFNKLGMWSFERYLRGRKGYPWAGKFQSALTVKRWLRHFGCSIVLSKTLCFLPPLEERPAKKWVEASDSIGSTCFPGMGSVYFVNAVKRKVGGHLLLADWLRRRVSIKSSVVEPT